MSNENQTEATFTLNIQSAGVEQPVSTGQSVREILTSRGVALDTPVLVNGEAVTLDSIIPQDSIVTMSSKGKGATDEAQATFTLNIQSAGVEQPEHTGQSVRDILTSRGVALDTPVLVNGEAVTLDSVIPQDSIVTMSSKGKGA